MHLMNVHSDHNNRSSLKAHSVRTYLPPGAINKYHLAYWRLRQLTATKKPLLAWLRIGRVLFDQARIHF